MYVNGFRVAALAVLIATLFVGGLVATPAASAAITGSSITTPADLTFFIDDNDLADQTFTISGTTSGGNPATDQVDINCYYNGGTTWNPVASGVPLNADGSFSLSNVDLASLENGPCQLRAVPAGTNPSDLSPFAGPRIGVGQHYSDPIGGGGPNNGQLYSAYLYAQQLTGAFDYFALGGDYSGSYGEVYDGYLYDSTLTNTSVTYYGNAGLLWNGGTRSELQIDGLNAYPVTAAAVINQNASELPALSYSYSLDAATGNLVIHETDPLVECPDPTYPPTSTSCASFVSAGVTDNITITQDHEGRIAWVSDVFSSTDGKSHSLDLLWDNNQWFNGNGSEIEYRFPGESGYSLHAVGDTVSLPASSPGTILMRVHGAADGDTQTGQGAIVYDRPATGATFTSVSNYSEFTLHQTGTVPAGGSTRFRFAYVQAYLAADVASMAQEASNAFLNTLSVAKAGNGAGTVISSPAGISCGSACSAGYGYGTSVTLTATPATGSVFTGWSGACSGTGSCTVTTNDTTSLTANFSLLPETLTVATAGTGSGTVTSTPTGINCEATCSHAYDYGSTVTLHAHAAKGSLFSGWSGACSGTGACTVTTKSATAVTAGFNLVPKPLRVTRKGDGKGTVTSRPAGISCGATCSHAYAYRTSVTLKARAGKGSAFAGWSGACHGRHACTLTMGVHRTVGAKFVKDCQVPKLTGKSLKRAKRALKTHDCRAGKIKHAFSDKVAKGHVISQKPKPHKHLKHGARIRLVVSKGKAH